MNNNKILKLIIGDICFKEFLDKVFQEIYLKFPEIKINNINIIIESYCKAILALGFNSNNIAKEEIKIETLENEKLKIEISVLKEKYNVEIKKVKEYKDTLLYF